MLDESCQTDRIDEGSSTFRSRKKRKHRDSNQSHQISQSTLIGTTMMAHLNVNESDSLWTKSRLDQTQDVRLQLPQ